MKTPSRNMSQIFYLFLYILFNMHVAVLPDDVDGTEYPDDFEDEDELAEVVSCARNAMQTLSGGDSLELKDSGGPSVTVKTLRQKYIGQCSFFLFF